MGNRWQRRHPFLRLSAVGALACAAVLAIPHFTQLRHEVSDTEAKHRVQGAIADIRGCARAQRWEYDGCLSVIVPHHVSELPEGPHRIVVSSTSGAGVTYDAHLRGRSVRRTCHPRGAGCPRGRW